MLSNQFQVRNTQTDEVVDSIDFNFTNQEFLRIAILQIFNDVMDGDTVNPLTIEELNKFVYLWNENELIERGIEWTWQHLIASTRKHLVDDGSLTRERIGKTTYYTLSN
jgi:hypothetical protein